MAENRIARVIAGTIEMFVGAYFVTFGALATVYFYETQHTRRALAAIVGALFGALLVFRAERLLGWKRWFFLIMIVPLLIIPVIWYIRPLIARH
jgi:hypothetical protein